MARQHQRPRYLLISRVAERFDIHPQTLRLYEREGLIKPVRSAGNTRLYDEQTLERLETILTLTREMGANLAGVEVILNMRDQLEELQQELHRVSGRLRRQHAERRGVARRYALVKLRRRSVSEE
jgi:MerR family transcriptional regulator/heat shock protein HspR